MKSSLKILIFWISALFIISITFLITQPIGAQPVFEKIHINDNTIRIQNSLGEPILDVELVENTDQCLVDCYAILRFRTYDRLDFPDSPNADFRWDFIKADIDMLGLQSHHFEKRETIPYTVKVPVYENQSYQCFNNETGQYDTCWYMAQTGSYEETRYKQVYKPFNFWGERLDADKDYYIKLVGKKYAVLGPNNIEWVPTIKGLEITEWAPWYSDWSLAKGIEIDTSGLSANLTNFTINITINTSELISNNKLQSDCDDLRFVENDNVTELKFHLDNDCNDDTLNTTIWVKVREIDKDNTTTIWMYYDYPSASNAEDEENTYDENYMAVWHLNESSTMAFDSTNYSNNGSMDSVIQVTGWFAKAHNFSDADDSYISVSDSDSLDFNDTFTIEAWVKPRDNEWAMVVLKDYCGKENGNAGNYYLQVIDTLEARIWFEDENQGNHGYNSDEKLTLNEWNYIAGTYDNANDEVKIYVNGTVKTHTGVTDVPDINTYPLTIGGYYDGSFTGLYDVEIDEIRISNIVRSADYFKANWDALYVTIGKEVGGLPVTDEQEGRTKIIEGIQDSSALGPDAPYYEDQQIYIYYNSSPDGQYLGAFDVVTQEGDQTWGFNYITDGDPNPKTYMGNLSSVVYIWEETNLTAKQIKSQVKSLINSTNQ